MTGSVVVGTIAIPGVTNGVFVVIFGDLDPGVAYGAATGGV